MAESYSINFLKVIRTLERIAGQRGFVAPSFRCPPPSAKFQRSLKKLKDDKVVVSIVVRDRPWLAVLADIVEGFVIANNSSEREPELRNLLWDSIASNDLQIVEHELSTRRADFVTSAA